MRLLIGFLGIFLILSCTQKKSKFVLDEKSEMAQLMLDMHTTLDTLQVKIKNNEDLGDFPENYEHIIDAPMTDESMRDENWETYATALLESQKALYKAQPEEQEEAYKKVISSCLACHTTVGCSGPIPKIEKLHWKPIQLN